MDFTFFDIVSPNITLYYKNQRKHSSLFSKIFSIVIIIFLLILSVYFSIDFVFKKNPYSYYYNRFITDTGIFPLNSSSMFHFIAFENSTIWDKNAFSMIGVRVSESNYILIKDIKDIDFWIYERCEVSDAGNKYKYLENFTKEFKNGLCIKKFYNSSEKQVYNISDEKFNYPTLEHGASNSNEKFYGLFIQRCLPKKKSLFNVSECYNTTYSDELMMIYASMYSIYFIDQNVDIENYKNPLDFYVHKISNRISTTSYTKNVLNFHVGEIKSRTGIIFEKINYIKTYIYDANEKVVSEKNEKNNNQEIYGSFYFSMQNMLNVYDRKYKRLQDVSANIGGIVKLVMILSKMINFFFYKYCIIKDLDNDMQLKYKKAGDIFEGIQFIKYLRMNTQLNVTNFTNNNKSIKNNNYIDYKNDKTNNKKNNSSTINIMEFENKFDILKKKKKNVYINNNESHSNSYNNVELKSKSYNHQTLNKFLNNNLTIIEKINDNSLFFYTIKSFLCIFNKNDPIHYLINYKKKILSEEEILTHHFFLKSLRKAFFENKNKNGFKIDFKDNNISNNISDFSQDNSKNIH